MNGIIVLVFCVLSTARTLDVSVINSADRPRKCERIEPDEQKLVYFGWRFTLGCDHRFTNEIDYEAEIDPNIGKKAQCIIRDNSTGITLWTTSVTVDGDMEYIEKLEMAKYKAPDVTKDSTETYEIMLLFPSSCRHLYVRLNKTATPEQECGNLPDELHYDFTAELYAWQTLPCDGLLHGPDLVRDGLKYTWYHNCSEVKDKTVNKMGQLDLYNTTFEDGGNYVCKVSYNGRSRYVRQLNVCVKYPSTAPHGISVQCNEMYSVHIAKDSTIHCTADMGTGNPNGLFLTVYWRKVENETEKRVCRISGLGQSVSSTVRAYAECMVGNAAEEACYQYNPRFSKDPSKLVDLNLLIRGVEEGDLGDYTLELSYNEERAFSNFSLIQGQVPMLKTEIVAVTVSICVILLIASAVIVCIFRKYDVLWCWKKHFGPYDKEDYPYTAYLAYYYNRADGSMSPASRNLTEQLVECLTTFIGMSGGRLYDDQREVSLQQYQAETILEAHKECHRIIIVLTPEYITDQWSLHTTYRALHIVMESGKKLIFIGIQGALEALEELSPEPKKTLVYAIKRNIYISWNGEIPFSGKLRRKLEYALPKLRSQTGNSGLVAASSQACLTELDNQMTTKKPAAGDDFGSMMI